MLGTIIYIYIYRNIYIYIHTSGGKVSLRKSVVQSVRQYDVMSRVRDYQNGEQSVHRGDIKISILSRKYCSDFLDLEILRVLLS